jgi:signal peptidase I
LQRDRDALFGTFGTSMRPLLARGDVVAVRGCTITEVRVGNVVVLNIDRDNNKYLLHRVIRKVGSGEHARLITKGDSSPRDLQHFTREHCVAKVREIYQEGHACAIHEGVWRPINLAVAGLSWFSSLFVDGYPFIRKKDFRRQVLPQRLSNSALKRLVRLGKRLTRRPAEPPGGSIMERDE